MTKYEQEFVIKNVNHDEWIKINVDPSTYFNVSVRYSNQMLNNHLPRGLVPKRLEIIDKIMDYKIFAVERQKLIETIENFKMN
uniref:Uncharacterized protein n=1 Tax=Panagrolaimus sp. JU765 TaxID=591449 RepID=A0AC34RQS0_9BILA